MKNLKVKSIFSLLAICTALIANTFFSSCGTNCSNCISITAPFVSDSNGLAVGFGIASIDIGPDCEQIGTLSWDYGNGIVGNDSYHEYSVPGTYNVCVTATAVNSDSKECTDTACGYIYIGAVTCDECTTVSPPTIGQTSPDGYTVMFNVGTNTNAAACNYDGTKTWNYGDGVSDTIGTHTYSTFGTYEVCVSVISYTNEGTECNDSACSTINIGT